MFKLERIHSTHNPLENSMRINRFISPALAIAGIVGMAAGMQAQPLSVRANGAKNITLSDKVGKNQLEWLSTAPLEEIKGTADAVSGSLTFDPKRPASLKGTIKVQVASMKTGNDMRDQHLHGSQWLDAAQYPAITFTIASVSGLRSAGGQLSGQASGSFTMHGITKQLTIPFTLQYIDESAKTRERAPGDLIAVTANFNVALKDFNVAGSKGAVGNKVGESIQISAKLFGSTGL
jgi:polyisoprenoid-binding protein YceI